MSAETPNTHQPVLADEVVALLEPRPGKVMLDGTAGAGGHAESLAERGARVIALDRDPSAAKLARERLARFGDRCQVLDRSFSEARSVAGELGLRGFDGTLLDLGVSSMQLDTPERGFSFRFEAPLDMRMEAAGRTAADLLRELSVPELARLLRLYGEEPFASPIARAIKRAARMETTADLVAAVESAVPRRAWPKKIHVATRTFQALRMAVNDELGQLDAYLADLPDLLVRTGRAVVISFHSLEDRRVKHRFTELGGTCRCPPKLPVCACGAHAEFRRLTRRAVVAGPLEIASNPRARSAKLRAVEKLEQAA
jgi:16S rRNA (cytosine1402-N4)-methyltransferase